ncbi:MAG: hypothetical protein WCO04_05890 [Pseudomonadota bacterium]
MTKPIPPKAAPPKPALKKAGGFNAGLTKPSDAGRTSAAMGGKGSSSNKGR